jgi:hypothetical protein
VNYSPEKHFSVGTRHIHVSVLRRSETLAGDSPFVSLAG